MLEYLRLSFVRHYDKNNIIKKGQINAPILFQSVMLFLLGCSPAEPKSALHDTIKVKENYSKWLFQESSLKKLPTELYLSSTSKYDLAHKIFSSWLRETFLSFASQIVFLPQRHTKNKSSTKEIQRNQSLRLKHSCLLPLASLPLASCLFASCLFASFVTVT